MMEILVVDEEFIEPVRKEEGMALMMVRASRMFVGDEENTRRR